MSATFVYFSIGSGLAIGVALLVVAVLLLRTARRYVDLAEERLELLREGEAPTPKVAWQQGHASRESRRPEPTRIEKVPEVVGHPLEHREGDETPRDFPRSGESDRNMREAAGGMRGQAPPADAGERRREGPQKAGTPGTPGAAASRPKDGAPLLGVKVPHPDDDVVPRGRNGSVANFFQRKYDLYLEQYERYVRLAERIHRMRDAAGESPGIPQSREWEDNLGRAHDAMERTTQRLDLLEHHYPELATDSGRLSHRLYLSRLQGELAERSGRSG